MLDYTDSHFIAVADGNVAIYENFTYVVHRTNLTDFDTILTENREFIERFTDTRAMDMVQDQTRQIQRLLQVLRVNRRHARSIDFIGSALKFIAGTPDHADLDMLTTKEDMLIRNNNRQSIINSALLDKINELTERINNLQESFANSNKINGDELIILELLSARNSEAIFFLNQLTLSITLAKANVANPVMLDSAELEYLLEHEMVPVSLNNLLKASSVSVYQENELIFYALKIPLVKENCKFLKIFPVIHNSSVVHMEVNTSSQCGNINTPVTDCVKAGETSICRITTDSCLTQLMNENLAVCRTETADSIPIIQKISEGTILLNNVQRTTVIDVTPLIVEGTALIIFSDNVTINGTVFYNRRFKSDVIEPHPPKTIEIKKFEHKEKLSLPYLHRIYLKNTNYIETLEDQLSNHKIMFLSILFIIVIIFCGVSYYGNTKKTKPLNLDECLRKIQNRSRDSPTQSGGAVSNS